MLTQPGNTREKLLRAAVDLVSEAGFGAATTAAIAAHTGLAEGTLYRHFKSKDELFIAAYRQLKSDVFERVTAETGTDTDMRARMRAMWLGMWKTYAHDLPAFTFGQRFAESAYSAQEGGAAHEQMMGHIYGIIADGQASGEIRAGDPAVLIAFFFPPLTAMLKQMNAGRDWSGLEVELAIDCAWKSWSA